MIFTILRKGTLFYRFLRLLYIFFCYIRRKALEKYHTISSRFTKQSGVTETKRDQELIVSLTTIPERINTIHLCINSLLRQSLKPDKIVLWLSKSNQNNRLPIDKDILPKNLIRLFPRGLEVQWCKDIRSYRKIIPALRTFPEALIVTADDDILYGRHWLRELYDAYKEEPQFIHCHRAHLIQYDKFGKVLPYKEWSFQAKDYQGPSINIFPTGLGGILYAPGHLDPEVLNEDVFLKLCPTADDVWLKAMSLLTETPCKKVRKRSPEIVEIQIHNNRTLWDENVGNNANDIQIAAVAKRYGVFNQQHLEQR